MNVNDIHTSQLKKLQHNLAGLFPKIFRKLLRNYQLGRKQYFSDTFFIFFLILKERSQNFCVLVADLMLTMDVHEYC